jgi:hypothetical protein
MAKGKSGRAKRRKLERDLAKRKSSVNISGKQIFQSLKYDLNDSQAKSLFISLPKERIKEVRGELLPKTYSELRKSGNHSSKDEFAKEIVWYTNELLDYQNEINEFLNLESKFECSFLAGNYEDSSLILDDIETKICVSQWSIEKRLLIAEYETGFKKNKEVLASIILTDNDPMTNLLSKYQSIRIEKKLSFFKYEEIFNNLLDAYSNSKAREYLCFKLNFFKQGKYNHKGFILSIENSGSIIDKYKSFIQCVLLFVSEIERDESIESILKINLGKLLNQINDNRIINSLYAIGVTPSFKINPKNEQLLNITDNYLQGKYELVLKGLESFFIGNSNIFELYEFYIKSTINLKRIFKNPFPIDSFAGKCLEDLNNIFNKNNKTENSFINAIKTYNSIGNLNWSYKYFAFVYNEHSSNFDSIDINRYSHLNSSYFNSSNTLFLKNIDASKIYLSKINESKPFISVDFYEQVINIINGKSTNKINVDVEPFRANLYYCQALQVSTNYELALYSYQNLLASSEHKSAFESQHNLIEVVQGILNCLLNLNKLQDAVILIASYNIANPNFANRLMSGFLLNKIIESDNEDLKREISTPIVLHQYKSFINPNDIWIAYDEFLFSYDLDYPKEIEIIIDKIDASKTIYFLKNICKQEVFDSSPMFENQDQLDNERIEICSLLTRIDRDNFEEYINEISEINRNLLIRQGIKQIDESKIYVDVKGIKNILEKDIKESFDRSMNLQTLSFDQIQKLDLNSDNVMIPYYDEPVISNKTEHNTSNLKITSYSRFEQFSDMFLKIRDKFIASNEFGIDTYLSMRIRHGTLLGEIRSVFENYYLITKKEDTSKDYKDNLYWQKLLSKSELELSTSFNKTMSDFSQKIDAISDELKNKKLQIKTEKKESEGYFDYSYDSKELLKFFKKRIASIDNYEVFFEEIIAILWERTEANLTRIREDISENIKEFMVSSLVNLSKEIEMIFDKNEHPEVNELIRNITLCQTDIKNELDKIAAWFKRTNSKTINEFYIQLPIDSTLTTLKRLFKEYQNLDIKFNINCSIKFEGENFPHFCYIFQNLMHNIIEHSGLNCDDLKVNIVINVFENEISIIILNNFSSDINLESRNVEIKKTHDLLLQSHDNDKIRAEKGTGYLKIQKTLKSDLLRESFKIIIDPVDDSRTYKTEINFNLKNLQKLEQ